MQEGAARVAGLYHCRKPGACRPSGRDANRMAGRTRRIHDNIAFREGKMLHPRRTLLSSALASAILLSSPHAFAQDAGTAPSDDEAIELDRVVVSGIRSSIERS